MTATSPDPTSDREPGAGLWRHSDFVRLWIGQTISMFGSTMGALPLTAILVLGATPAQMGLLAAAGSAPALLLGLPVGAWVDRARRRPLMVTADLGRTLLLASIPAAWWLGRLRIVQVYLVAFLAGILSLLFDIAYPSFLPSLVGRSELVEANSKLGMSSSTAEIAGQSIGGGLVQFLGAPMAVLIDALSFLCSAFAVGTIRSPEPQPPLPERRGPIAHEILGGLKAVGAHPILRVLAGATTLFSFCGGFFAALYGLYAIRDLGLSPAMLGGVVACGGAGSLLGAALAERTSRRLGLGRTLAGTLLLAGPLGFLVPLAHRPLGLAIPMLVTGQILGDLLLTIFFVNEISLRQAVTPGPVLGRTNAGIHVMEAAGGMAGALVGGALGGMVGMRATLALSVTGWCGIGVWVACSPVRQQSQVSRDGTGEVDPAPHL